MQATFLSDGNYIDYTPATDVAAGAVVVQGDFVGVATSPLTALRLGALCVRGIFDMVMAAVQITAGAPLYWDADGNPVGGTPGTGAITTSATGNKFAGFASAARAATDTTVPVALRSVDSTSAETKSIADLSDVGPADYTAGKILVADGDSYETVAVSGDATLAANGAATVNAAIKEETVLVPIAGLGAGADLAAAVHFAVPRACSLVSVGYLVVGTDFGTIDDGNTAVFAVTDGGGNAIVSKTYNTATQPTANALNDLGALDGTHKALTAGEVVKLAITNGASAKSPAGFLVVRFIPTNA